MTFQDAADTAPKADQRERKCTHCGEMLPDDPQILKLHDISYHNIIKLVINIVDIYHGVYF